jgi:phosphatidylserine/phosphatidylglycerophosphate/cardiolipin synthase-like enzyme
MLDFITDTQIYERVIRGRVPKAKEFVWLATADLKDLYVNKPGRKRMVPFLEILSDLAAKGVEIRLLHAKEPGPAFRKDFDKYPGLLQGLERIVCPRVHFKSVMLDGTFAYSGSANLTGAGMGAKSSTRRNFESGIITTDKKLIEQITKQFLAVWTGKHCKECKRKEYCSEH